MRYLGYLYDNTQQKWLKELLRSELVARCAKQSLSEDLQEYSFVSRESFNSTQSNPIGSHERLQAKRVISFLNVLFGHSSSTDRLWEKMDSYCEIHFKCFLLSRKVD